MYSIICLCLCIVCIVTTQYHTDNLGIEKNSGDAEKKTPNTIGLGKKKIITTTSLT